MENKIVSGGGGGGLPLKFTIGLILVNIYPNVGSLPSPPPQTATRLYTYFAAS